jgi:phage-related protein
MKDEWVIEYYVEENGNIPVRNFLESLDEATYARLARSFERLRERNIFAKDPLVKHIQDKIWELRVESNTNTYRILYIFFSGKRIILLHGFSKKTQKLPQKELDIAKKRLADFLQRKAGK